MSKLIKRENISLAFEKYKGKDGEEKTAWRTIGEVLTFEKEDGTQSKKVKIYAMPGADIALFKQELKPKKEEGKKDIPF